MKASTLIADIVPGDVQLSIQVDILETLVILSGQVSLQNGARNISVAEIVIGDQSGVAILELIDDQIAQLKQGMHVTLYNVTCKISRGFARLRSEPFKFQNESDGHYNQDINYSHNISNIEYEPILAALMEN